MVIYRPASVFIAQDTEGFLPGRHITSYGPCEPRLPDARPASLIHTVFFIIAPRSISSHCSHSAMSLVLISRHSAARAPLLFKKNLGACRRRTQTGPCPDLNARARRVSSRSLRRLPGSGPNHPIGLRRRHAPTGAHKKKDRRLGPSRFIGAVDRQPGR